MRSIVNPHCFKLSRYSALTLLIAIAAQRLAFDHDEAQTLQPGTPVACEDAP